MFSFGMTTYQESFQRSNGQAKSMRYSQSMRNFRSKPAGTTEKIKLEGKKLSTLLTAENYRDYEDPQKNTHIQRSWVHGKDRTLDVAEKRLRRTTSTLGGSATKPLIMSNYRKSIYPKFKIGDGLNSVPLESKLQLSPYKLTIIRRDQIVQSKNASTRCLQKNQNQHYKKKK